MMVTWGLCHHGDSLYSACDNQYDSKIYTVPPPGPPTGRVIRARLGENGLIKDSSVFTKVGVQKTDKSRRISQAVELEYLNTLSLQFT